jgi:tRNA (pseudouridine54-N1)-methyltransferase
MREFIYYSKNAITTGKFDLSDLMKAGRMDIVCNVIISCFFLSKDIRDDVRLHLIFDGPPRPPVHLIFESGKEMPISKKDIGGLIKRMLYKTPQEQGKLVKVFPGCFVEKKSFEKIVNELEKKGKNIFLLNKRGKDIRELELKGNEVYIIGDHDGFGREKERFLKRIDKVSVSPRVLFASQVFVLIHNEIDRVID